jgi:hypothetical protein
MRKLSRKVPPQRLLGLSKVSFKTSFSISTSFTTLSIQMDSSWPFAAAVSKRAKLSSKYIM